MNIPNKTKGFTIIEVLIATFILISAFGAIMGLAISSMRANRLTQNELIANNLAQEGIEMVRSLRDNKWKICPEQAQENCWKKITSSDTEPEEGTIYIIGEDFFSQSGIFLNPLISQTDSRIFLCEDLSVGFYIHDNVKCENSTPTSFYREITFGEHNVPTINGQNISPDQYLVVRSSVSWKVEGKTHEYALEEVLYNWKDL